jgi:hypothetical protein
LTELLLQGCLVQQKKILDFYFAIPGVPNGVERNVFGWAYLGFGSYCNPDSEFRVSGKLTQAGQAPSQMMLRYAPFGMDPIFGGTLNLDADGTIPEQSFPFPTYCHDAGALDNPLKHGDLAQASSSVLL